jgi:hypothetical protein
MEGTLGRSKIKISLPPASFLAALTIFKMRDDNLAKEPSPSVRSTTTKSGLLADLGLAEDQGHPRGSLGTSPLARAEAGSRSL